MTTAMTTTATEATQFVALKELLPFNASRTRVCQETELAAVCKDQHDFVQKLPFPLQEAFCIVIKPPPVGDNEFTVQIRLNVSHLEKLLIGTFPNERATIYEAVSDYLDQEDQRELNEVGRQYADPQPDMCRFAKRRCKNAPKKLHFPVCSIDHCGFVVPEHHALVNQPPYAPANYLVLFRDKLYRDLLLMPAANPPSSIPHTNHALIGDEKAWRAIVDTARAIAAKAMPEGEPCFVEWHVNFGKWESAVARNPRSADCHAHVHLLLTRAAALRLGTVHPEFQGFLDVPEDDDDHRRECRRLRLRLPTSRVVEARIDRLGKHMNIEFTGMDTKFTELFTEMNTKLTQMGDTLQSILEVLELRPVAVQGPPSKPKTTF